MNIYQTADKPALHPTTGQTNSLFSVRDGEFITLAPQQLQTSSVSFGPFITKFFDSKFQSSQTPLPGNESILYITESARAVNSKKEKDDDSNKL